MFILVHHQKLCDAGYTPAPPPPPFSGLIHHNFEVLHNFKGQILRNSSLTSQSHRSTHLAHLGTPEAVSTAGPSLYINKGRMLHPLQPVYHVLLVFT